jgi:glycerol-3-phosphate dehydrogenase
MKKRTAIWQDIKQKTSCQVLILGGGVNGTGLLRDLALQGVTCVLVDKDDFSAGASSKSSRMIHGGLRYLENREFKLVSEAVSERNRLLRNAPHFIHPLKTTIPIDSWFGGLIKSPLMFLGLPVKVGGRGALIVKIGLTLYDIITGKHRQTPRHFFSSKTQAQKDVPGMRTNIACTATYWDAWISQAERLWVEMIQEACTSNPDCAAINYVTAAKQGTGEVLLTDQATGEETRIKPDIVVNATGAWVDYANKTMGVESAFMGGTKGSHLVIDNRELYNALGDRMVFYEHTDGRVCITFQFMDKVIMGSTDLRVDHPDNAQCDDAEIDYMMTTLKGVFPHLTLSKDDIVFTFCGVRPLAASHLEYTSRASRSHNIAVSEPDAGRTFRIYSMIGGKLTTFGAFAQQTADKILSELVMARRNTIGERPYAGAVDYPTDDAAKEQWAAQAASEHGVAQALMARLLERYGTLAQSIVAHKKGAMTALQSLPDYTVGELQYMAEQECIRHLSDLVRRRSTVTLLGQARQEVLSEMADIVGEALDWDDIRKKDEIALALKEAGDRK